MWRLWSVCVDAQGSQSYRWISKQLAAFSKDAARTVHASFPNYWGLRDRMTDYLLSRSWVNIYYFFSLEKYIEVRMPIEVDYRIYFIRRHYVFITLETGWRYKATINILKTNVEVKKCENP